MQSQNKLISVSSNDCERLNGDKLSKVAFQFRDVLHEDDALYSTVSIESAEIAHSFYIVTESANTIRYEVLHTPYSMVIPEGNYNMRSFKTIFETLFASGGHNKTATLGIDATTGKYTLMPGDSSFTIIIKKMGTTAERIIGLANDQTFPFQSSAVSFEYPANFLGATKIKVFSTALSSHNLDSSGFTETNLLDTISVNAAAFGLITYSNQTSHEYILRSHVVNVIDFELRDEHNQLIDFNNQDWSITLMIKTYRSEDDEKIETSTFSAAMDLQRRGEMIRLLKKNYPDAPVVSKPKPVEDEENDDLSAFEDEDLELLLAEN